MLGEQERPNGLAGPDQPDLIDSTLTMSRPAGREQGPANGHRRDGLADGGVGPAGEPYHGARDGEIAEPAQVQAAAEPLSPAEPRRTAEHRAAPAAEAREPARYRPDAVSGGRPQPGSLADFRQRLERLPYGHPSSPYHVDGERKPPPPRLRHLELAPPAAAARPPAPVRPAPAPPPATVLPAAAPPPAPAPPATVLPADAPSLAPAPPATVLPAPAPPTLSEQGRSEQARSEQAAAPPGPSWPTDLGRREPTLRGHEAPAAPDPPWATAGGARSVQPRESHQASTRSGWFGSPGSQPSGGVQADQPPRDVPHIAADGSWNWGPARLTRDQVRIAEDAYDRFRAADGRSLLGGPDHGSGLTAAMHRIEELGLGRLGAGSSERALLPPDVFRARLADMLRRHPDRTPEQLSMRVTSALCYVFVLEDEQYADGIRDIEEALYAQGYQLQARKNGWASPANRSVFTIWHDPFNDVLFQVQFHTEASLDEQRHRRAPAPAGGPSATPGQAETVRLAGG
jgi:hypothetical protein